VKDVVTYLASPQPSTVLALVAVEMMRDLGAREGVAKAGQVLAYDVTSGSCRSGSPSSSPAAGAKADADACRALIDIVGERPRRAVDRDSRSFDVAAATRCRCATSSDGGRACRDIDLSLTDAWGRRDIGAVLARGGDHGALVTALGRAAHAHHRVARLHSAVCVAARSSPTRYPSARRRTRLKIHPFAADEGVRTSGELLGQELGDALVPARGARRGGRRAARGCLRISSSSARSST